MNTETARKALNSAPFFTEKAVNKELFGKFSALKATLESRGADDHHQLNSKTVTGVWYLTHLSYDGRPQIMVRTTIDINSFDGMLLDSEIFQFVGHDAIFDVEKEAFGGDAVIIGQQAELLKEIEAGRVLTVYNVTRRG